MEVDPFTRLVMEKERTLFFFYGYRWANGEQGRGYFKLAYSLSQALADLENNDAVADEGGYFVQDAFVETEDAGGDPVIHVELISLAGIFAGKVEEED